MSTTLTRDSGTSPKAFDLAKIDQVKRERGCAKKPGCKQVSDAFTARKMKPMHFGKRRHVVALPVDSSLSTESSSGSETCIEYPTNQNGIPCLSDSAKWPCRVSSKRQFQRFIRKETCVHGSDETCRRRVLEQSHTDVSVSEPNVKSCLRTMSTTSDSPTSKTVSFSTIHIYEHEVTVGDNPSVMSGAPVSLDWKVQQQVEMKVDDYESSRRGKRRSKSQMRMPASVREELLVEKWEIPYRQVLEASRTARKAHAKRIDSCKHLFADGARLALEQTARACRKIMTRTTKKGKQNKIMNHCTTQKHDGVHKNQCSVADSLVL